MKKLLFGAAALTLLMTASCKKSDDNGTSSNTIKIGGNSYSVSTISRSGSTTTLTATNTSGASATEMIFNFSTLPTANGTFKVVSGTSSLTSSTVNVTTLSAGLSGGTSYSTTGNDNVSATVTVNSGKITISLPSAWAANLSNSKDSLQVSGNVTEQ